MLNLLPYIFVNRSCFIYHYMPALFYGEIMTALFFDKVAGTWWWSLHCRHRMLILLTDMFTILVFCLFLCCSGRRWMPFAMKSFLLVALCSWVYFMPWVYAFREYCVLNYVMPVRLP